MLGVPPKEKIAPSLPEPHAVSGASCLTHEEMKKRERENILLALQRTGWKIYGPGGAAELLGLKPNTLAARMKVMGVRKDVRS